MKNNELYAEDLPYWQTSQSHPDIWLEKAQKEIVKIGGEIVAEAFGKDSLSGQSAYMIQFNLDNVEFKIVWPVMPTRTSGKELAAKRQAATMMFYDVKNKCIASRVHGIRAAFFQYLVLPDGRTAHQLASPDLVEKVPSMFSLPVLKKSPPLLGETVDE